MTKPPRHTDLSVTEGDPTPRGDPIVQRIEVEARLKALVVKLSTRTGERSPAGIAVAVLMLVIAGAVCAVAMNFVGAPGWAALAGLLVPAILYWLVMRNSRGTTR